MPKLTKAQQADRDRYTSLRNTLQSGGVPKAKLSELEAEMQRIEQKYGICDWGC
ncbi:hypothetical protein [Paenibacillus cymbidii]|uniref:hypothetical protein n=1 Tax=Paenibacillus cymbidii TaxID=1639034 RepID=UPI001436889E|nr:hypothetical protein [Paenibacillus cymbidii]